MRYLLYILFITSIAFPSLAQNRIAGVVCDAESRPLGYSTVALLDPEDSTLAHFGITDVNGRYEIRSVQQGRYLLQTSYIGYKPLYIQISIPEGIIPDTLKLQPLQHALDEVSITAERSPITIKEDTIEYNARSFKSKPDAVTEDLLRKLPGIEVDREGNIKAQGEEVTNVLVDGKEFFSNDPKVATKNLPADALDRIQVYDKKSEQAELTGIDDGEREKTLNLLLKSDRKSAYFGDVVAGYGTDDHYKASARFYRFTEKKQIAFLGMMNNINQYGFSFRDFMNFSGGMKNMMSGDGNVELNSSGNLPVNFGRPVNGLATSGAGGLNYTYEPRKNNRINLSYLITGSDKEKDESIYTENYADSLQFISMSTGKNENENRNHSVNMNWKNRVDSMQSFTANGTVELSNNNSLSTAHTLLSSLSQQESSVNDEGVEEGVNIGGRGRISYIKRWSGKWTVFRMGGDVNFNNSSGESEWDNSTYYALNDSTSDESRFRNDDSKRYIYSINTSLMRRTGKHSFLEPAVEAGLTNQAVERKEGLQQAEYGFGYYDFQSDYFWIRPALSFKFNKKKKNLLLGARMEFFETENMLDGKNIYGNNDIYFLPRFNYENEYRKGKRFGFNYNTRVSQPAISYLLPVINDRNPLEIRYGNVRLKPEYQHSVRFNWSVFDQFSFTSFFSNFYARYTKDKINWSTRINESLQQEITPVNTADDYMADLNFEVSTPVKFAHINISIDAGETFSQTLKPVNEKENKTTQFTHHFGISIDNRKKDHLEISAGMNVNFTNARYTLNDDPAEYIRIDYFADASYKFGKRFLLGGSADIVSYTAQSFAEKVSVPLITAFATVYFLKSERLSVTLEGFDLMNKNKGIERVTELNYIRETRTSIIGRYFLLTLKYRLNRFDSKDNVKVDVK